MNRAAALIVPALALLFGLIDAGPAFAGGATFTVDTTGNLSDSATGDNLCNDGTGKCSLRAAIEQSNATTGSDIIAFDIPDTEAGCAAGLCSIAPITPFPLVTDPVTIDGTTQPAFDPVTSLPVITLDGIQLAGTVDGLRVTAGNTTIRGLGIVRFGTVAGSDGIEFSTFGGNTVEGNCIGGFPFTCDDCDQDLPGTGDEFGPLGSAVFINGTSNNTIGGASPEDANFLVCSEDAGVSICTGVVGCGGIAATGNLVIGNFIGTDREGATDLGNAEAGVLINNAQNNTIGGTSANNRNLIGGNGNDGVQIIGAGATDNTVLGNYIGTNASGTDSMRNTGAGVNINGAPNNTVGGTAVGAGNLISGNLQGVELTGAGAKENKLQGNFIGTNALGTDALDPTTRGNLGDGVYITQGAKDNTIGGTSVAARNIISGNGSDGVEVFGTAVSGNLIQGNYIGLDVSGTLAIHNGSETGNTGNGIKINGAPLNKIGGPGEGEGNVISGNESRGVEVTGSNSNGTVIQGNFIGTSASGASGIGNGQDGVFINGAKNTVVGGTVPGAPNVISGNAAEFLTAGVFIQGAGATGNLVQGNLIGTDVTGAAVLGNWQGVFVNGAPNNTIGGTTDSARNIISGNGGEGVILNGPTATNVLVQGNYVGLNAAGSTVIANGGDGVRIASSSGNVIGGTSAGARNVVSGNGAVGIDILVSSGNSILGNFVGTDKTGTLDRGNALEGVYINGGVNNTVGGSSIGARNIISGNQHGVGLNDIAAQGNQIIGNFIGTNAFGTGPVANTFDGVRVAGNASNNVVGGGGTSGNVIAYNGGDGVFLDQTAGTGNRIDLNQIFLNGQLAIDIFPNGVTTNDAGDPDTGPNNVQNFPVLSSANSTVSGTTIVGTLNSNANSTFSVQIFSDASCDPSGNGEGQFFVGTVNVNTDGSGNGSFNQLFATVVADQHVVTATARDPGGNTSEFSGCRTVVGVPQPPLKQGDVNCDNNVNAVDALLVLRYAAALSVIQNEPCPNIGTVLSQVFGDVDCTGVVNSVDALKIQRFAAALSVLQTEPCTDMGLLLP